MASPLSTGASLTLTLRARTPVGVKHHGTGSNTHHCFPKNPAHHKAFVQFQSHQILTSSQAPFIRSEWGGESCQVRRRNAGKKKYISLATKSNHYLQSGAFRVYVREKGRIWLINVAIKTCSKIFINKMQAKRISQQRHEAALLGWII